MNLLNQSEGQNNSISWKICGNSKKLGGPKLGGPKLGGPKLGGPILGGPIKDRYCNEFMNFTNNYKELILLLLCKLSIFKE